MYFFFYRFTFNFGYFWIGLFIIFFSSIFSRVLKYKFYNLYFLYKEFYDLFIWFSFIFNNLKTNFLKIFEFFNIILIFNLLIFFSSLNNFFYYFYKYFLYFLKSLQKKRDYGYVFIWKNYNLNDKSFLKYKSLLNWFNQLYKVLIY